MLHRLFVFSTDPFLEHADTIDERPNALLVHLNIAHGHVVLTSRKAFCGRIIGARGSLVVNGMLAGWSDCQTRSQILECLLENERTTCSNGCTCQAPFCPLVARPGGGTLNGTRDDRDGRQRSFFVPWTAIGR